MMGFNWDSRAVAAAPIPLDKLPLIENAVTNQCDASLPEYCSVQGNIGPGTIGFVVQLPTKWKAAPKQADDD